MDALNLWKLQLEQLLAEMAEQTDLYRVHFSSSVARHPKSPANESEQEERLKLENRYIEPLKEFAKKHKLFLAFQGCEHINRALTIERHAAEKFMLDPVSVIPMVHAGGSMSAYAYQHMDDPVVVEEIRANAGIDIGQTLIGMHLKRVAVPLPDINWKNR